MTTLTIVIVSWNARADLQRCLDSLLSSPARADHEIVVVDNGSTDGAPEMVARRFPSVRLLGAGGNLGFAAANNLAIRGTASELVLLLNPDTIVQPHAIDRLVGRLRALPRAAAIGPLLLDEAGRPERSFGPAPSPAGELWQKTAGWLWRQSLPGVKGWIQRETRRERRVRWISGAAMLLRRADLERAGLLDERYFLYWEDVDLCLSLGAQKREVWFTPAATIVHARGRSAAESGGASRTAYRQAQIAFYGKRQPQWLPWLRAYLRFIGEWPAGSSGTPGPGDRVQ
jgi:GT2 family glycosyltransferase